MKIYIACSLTHTPREIFSEYVETIHALAGALKEQGHVVKYALVDSDPQLAEKPFNERASLCYLWDRAMVEDADLIVAETSFPSTGLGVELQLAEVKGIPAILCFRDVEINKALPAIYENPDHTKHDLQIGEGYVTLLALGLPNVFRVVKYSDGEDGIARVVEVVSLLSK